MPENVVGVYWRLEAFHRRTVSLFYEKLHPSAPPSCILMLFILNSKLTTANFLLILCTLLPPAPTMHVCAADGCSVPVCGSALRASVLISSAKCPFLSPVTADRVSLKRASEDVCSEPASGDSLYRRMFVVRLYGFLTNLCSRVLKIFFLYSDIKIPLASLATIQLISSYLFYSTNNKTVMEMC